MITVAELSALLGVIWIDLVLAGDNAIVVGLAAAGLPRQQRTKVIFIGILAATVLRIVFAFMVTQLMAIIGLLLAGGILLLWVCWKLWRELRQQPHQDAAVDELEAGVGDVLPTADFDGSMQQPATAANDRMPTKTFSQAVIQIVVADVSMSLDNVLAVGGIAREHDTWILIVGLTLSVAFMGAAATFIAGLLKRFHWIAYVGLLIILYVALAMIVDGAAEVCGSMGWNCAGLAALHSS
ncbi:MAG: YjbE family putative metal transport protein [Dongiaceae bacterium]